MWSLIDGKHNVSVPHHDGLFVGRVGDCLDEEMYLMPGRTTQRMRMEGQRWTSFCPEQSVVSDLGNSSIPRNQE